MRTVRVKLELTDFRPIIELTILKSKWKGNYKGKGTDETQSELYFTYVFWMNFFGQTSKISVIVQSPDRQTFAYNMHQVHTWHWSGTSWFSNPTCKRS